MTFSSEGRVGRETILGPHMAECELFARFDASDLPLIWAARTFYDADHSLRTRLVNFNHTPSKLEKAPVAYLRCFRCLAAAVNLGGC